MANRTHWRHQSPYGVVETLDRLEAAIAKNPEIACLARIDQTAEMGKAGVLARPCEMLLFENRKLVGALYDISPESLFWLPIRALAWEDESGISWLRVPNPDRLADDTGAEHASPLIATIHRVLGEMLETVLSDEPLGFS